MIGRPALLIVLLAVSCAPAGGGPSEVLGWAGASPAAVGVDSSALAELDLEFTTGVHGYVDAMLVIRAGKLIYQSAYPQDYGSAYGGRDSVSRMYNYYDPTWHPFYRGSRLHTLQSVSKSVTSAVYGVAQARGEMPDLDAPVLSFFDSTAVANLDDRKRRMTVRHLLTMTAGFAWDEGSVPYTDPRNNCAVMEASDDWVRYVIDRPMAAEPGQVFVYNSGATVLLAYIFERATGHDLGEYAVEHLFGPLGITTHFWKRTPNGLPDAEGGLYLQPEDLARIGVLFLDGGVWNGERLIEASWVTESTTPVTGARFRYGYQWWLVPHPDGVSRVWAALGYGGQLLLILPDQDVVAVFTGWNIDENPTLSPVSMVERLVDAIR